MKCYMTGRECDHFRESGDQNKMFIVSPFGFPYDLMYEEGGTAWKALKEKAGVTATRSDSSMRLGSIMCQGICKEIIGKQYLLADVSQPNANVYYELGLAFGLPREIVICVDRSVSNPYVDMFRFSQEEPKWIEYDSVSTLVQKLGSVRAAAAILLEDDAQAHEFRLDISPPMLDGKVLIIENGEGGVSGVHGAILQRALEEMTLTDDSLMTGLSNRERAGIKDKFESWTGKWRIETVRLDRKAKRNDLVKKIQEHRICLVDTTPYARRDASCGNPYMFFALGLCHGLEREAIPITSAADVENTPFDVQGLWHIFFRDHADLCKGLKGIMPQISVACILEIQDEPYRRIWGDSFRPDQPLAIIYCGRPQQPTDPRKGRTNIDSWDSKAVTEASSYLAQKYPTATIKTAPPQTKKPGKKRPAELVDIEKEFTKEYPNCVIVGSPDVNDYAEFALSRIFGVPPFRRPTKKRLETASKDEGFVFKKTNISPEIWSAFSVSEHVNRVLFFGKDEPCVEPEADDDGKIKDGATYGVLTLSPNPFVQQGEGRIVVLSGFTGLATSGLMLLLVDSDTDDYKDVRSRFDEVLRNEIARAYAECKVDQAFSVLVRFDYNYKSACANGTDGATQPKQEGDDRCFTNVAIEGLSVYTKVQFPQPANGEAEARKAPELE